MSSVGVKNTYISIQITQTIAQIELIESQLKELETVIEAAVDELDSVIMTVPGIGKLNGAMILGEIGDIIAILKIITSDQQQKTILCNQKARL